MCEHLKMARKRRLVIFYLNKCLLKLSSVVSTSLVLNILRFNHILGIWVGHLRRLIISNVRGWFAARVDKMTLLRRFLSEIPITSCNAGSWITLVLLISLIRVTLTINFHGAWHGSFSFNYSWGGLIYIDSGNVKVWMRHLMAMMDMGLEILTIGDTFILCVLPTRR